jgi:tyrosinase
MKPDATTSVTNPTWYDDIRDMFNQTDIDHMKSQGLDLTSYDEVKNSAGGIYSQVSMGNMPPKAPWPEAWITTFLNWMTNDYPKGTPQSTFAALLAAAPIPAKASRIRKEITSLTQTELDNLIKAFSEIMAKDNKDPNSYFVQAGYHWLPAPTYCQHHAPAYNPWHRAYLVSFENALRSVPGCENVTLPYWDITTPFPDILKSAPFDKYTLPEDIGGGFAKGYVTERHDYTTIQQNLKQFGVTEDIDRALSKTDWEDFHGYFAGASNNTIVSAHDSGHVAIGPTMENQAVAAFDPVFWFFHANWDRLFWTWQKQMQAVNLNGLLSTINKQTDLGSYQLFTNPVLKEALMAPFATKSPNLDATAIIDSENSLDIDYEEPKALMHMKMLPKIQRTSLASQKFFVHTDFVNVRIKGLNRLKIPGSFKVHLLKDGNPIASRAFFQPVDVEKCENCVNNAIVHFDFELPLEDISNGQLGVWVEPVDKSVVGDRFPHKLMENPTVDVRFLLSNE